MTVDLDRTSWLEELVEEELASYDVEAARARFPEEARAAVAGGDLAPGARLLVLRSLRPWRLGPPDEGPHARFLEVVRGHVGLLLDLALLAGEPFRRHPRRGAIAAALAAALGDPAAALDADPSIPGAASPRAVSRAFAFAGRELRGRFDPPGDPKNGLPLYPGSLAVLRRHLARVAIGAHRSGRLDPEALARHQTYARRETVLLVEAIAGLCAAAPLQLEEGARAIRLRQLARLGLPRAEQREARRAMLTPRPPAALAVATPPRVRPFLLEHLLLAQLRARLPAEPASAYVDAFVAGGAIDAQTLVAAQVEAAAQHGDHQVWFEAVGEEDWQALAGEWEATADELVERVTGVVNENLEALVTEVRETGELGALLAQAAAGKKLDAEERRKVKAQLIDLAKAVPALAIFAAPGGMLLLPLLAKLLPFNVLPSAWDRTAPAAVKAKASVKATEDVAAGPAGPPDRLSRP